jgi:hypothetical protein
MINERLGHLRRFYSILDRHAEHVGGARKLADCSGRMLWPIRGVYFFREPGQQRSDSGEGPRVVRVGTHALKAGSGTKLWTRLSQHKGQMAGGGNHRGSIFRLIVGTALMRRDGMQFPTWGTGNAVTAAVRTGELGLECEVSKVIGAMSVLWLSLEDDASPVSRRGYIERNSIALLSNYDKTALDGPSESWLGQYCNREKIRKSGLWNSNHVDETYDPAFLDELDRIA